MPAKKHTGVTAGQVTDPGAVHHCETLGPQWLKIMSLSCPSGPSSLLSWFSVTAIPPPCLLQPGSECSHWHDQSFPTRKNIPASEGSGIKFRMERPGFINYISNALGMAFCNLLPLRSVQMPKRLFCACFSVILFLSPFCLCGSGKGGSLFQRENHS